MSEGPPDTTPTRAELWDARHAAHEPIESADADPTLIEVAATLTPGAALDLGSGDGRNAGSSAKPGPKERLLLLPVSGRLVARMEGHDTLVPLPGPVGAPRMPAAVGDRQYAATELFDLLTAYEEGIVGPARSAGPAP